MKTILLVVVDFLALLKVDVVPGTQTQLTAKLNADSNIVDRPRSH